MLDGYQKNLLERIGNGDLTYAAQDMSENSLRHFARLAETLLGLEREGLIVLAQKMRENVTGFDFFSLIVVRGLTKSGRAMIKNDSA